VTIARSTGLPPGHRAGHYGPKPAASVKARAFPTATAPRRPVVDAHAEGHAEGETGAKPPTDTAAKPPTDTAAKPPTETGSKPEPGAKPVAKPAPKPAPKKPPKKE
jgi:hypothetical protein